MNLNTTTIAIDAMGGDNAPFKILKGLELFLLKNHNCKIILLGDKDLILQSIKNNNIRLFNYELIHTAENIKNDDSASTILRKRKESSMFKGLEIIKKIDNSGFVSAGNTAALMILSRLHLGMIEGIDRPAICSIIPNRNDYSIMLDLGANSTVVAKNLLQFSIMGFCYHSLLKPDIVPKIGIINIGTEDNKGLEFLKDAFDLISNSFLNKYFIGFVEPDKITSGECDIMVSDGYTGNIMLKTAEGMSEFITYNLKKVFKKSIKNNIAYKLLEKDLKLFKDQINPDKYNGATFVGINGISIKSHGGASPFAFSCAIQRCYDFIHNDINKKIRESFKKI